MRIRQLLALASAMICSGLAFASTSTAPGNGAVIPEPEILALLGVGALALFITRRRNKK